MKTIKLAILGFGNVGRAFAKMIHDKRSFLNSKGLNPIIISVSDAYQGAAFDPEGLPIPELLATRKEKGGLAQIINGTSEPKNDELFKSGADVFIEASFTNPETGEPAVSFCQRAQAEGMKVITTNKGPAVFSQELDDINFRYEGTVMSGTPVVSFIEKCLPGAEVTAFRGIYNGTCNYILGLMENGVEFEAALADAQEKGFAEADPTADIEGYDAMMKVIITSKLLFGKTLSTSDVIRSGITRISQADVMDARLQSKRWKLIASGKLDETGSVVATVGLELLDPEDVLFGINGATNAIALTTDVLGDVMVAGPGAGLKETAYALFADMLYVLETV